MVKAILGIFLVLWGLGPSVRALPPSDSPGTSAVAQDATGTVWALTNDNGRYGALRRWQAGTGTAKAGDWIFEAIPGADRFQPRVMTRGDDGSVYVFWQTSNLGQTPLPQCLVTVHRGINSRILARFSDAVVTDVGLPFTPMFSAGVGGDVWLAGYQPILWHISSNGTITAFRVPLAQYFRRTQQDPYPPHPFSSLRDAEGRRWFWQGGGNPNWQSSSLRGVVIWDGKTLDYHPTIPGVPDRPFSVLVPQDKDHLWLAIAGEDYVQHPPTPGGLYRVDIHTLSAEAETPPQSGALQNVAQLFRVNGDWYAVDQTPYNQPGILWRERAGQWRKSIDKLEEIGGYYTPDFRHPWLAEPSGIWLGVNGGAWWLPRDGRPALWADWRHGVPALDFQGLFPLANGRILAVGPQGAEAEMPSTPQSVGPLPPGLVTGGMGAPKYLGPLISDPRHHLWETRIYSSGPRPLDEWNGKQWRTHLPPKSITGLESLYACDTLGRIWLMTSNWNPPAQPQPVEGRAVYDPARDTWTNYVTVQEALQAAARLPGMAFLPYRNTYQPPVFSSDGRVTYAYSTTIYLYDGRAWKHWGSGDLLRDHGGNQPARLHFNQDGHLELTLDIQICEWTPESGWKRIGEQKPENYENPVPPNGPHGLWGNPIVDDLGEKWFVWQDAVYTAWDGLWAKQDELSGPNSPFRYGYGIEDVLRDPFGRLFFVTRPAGYYDLVVWSPPPVPKPTLSVVPAADDAVTVRVRARSGGPRRVLWRLNGGAWSAPQATDRVTLAALPRGDYRVEVQAVDRRLQTSVPPTVAVFSIRVAPGTQIARWLRALLHGTDEEREAAVAGLVKQPDAALPALAAARPGASEAGRWWLDAAAQQIMEQKQGAGSAKQ